jgi:flagellar hook-length control protein FliK
MGISDISGKLASIIATPRLASLEAALQASLSLTHAPVSTRLPRVDKLGGSSVARQAIDSPSQPVLKSPHDNTEQGLRQAEPVLTQLSKTASFLSSLMTQQDRSPVSRATLPASQPVLDEPPHYPGPLAIALQSTLQESGLFYESHLLSWYQGHYPRDRLLKEPQSQLASQSEANLTPQKTLMNQTGVALLPEHLEKEPQTLLISRADSSIATVSDSREQTGLTPPPNEAAKLITQQLLLLDKPSLEWSVNVWPGQTATLLIEEESPRSSEAQSTWSTTIQLDFPRLGHMEISLKMDAEGLHVHLDAENESVIDPMKQQRLQCAERLASTGCRLREFSIGNGHANT